MTTLANAAPMVARFDKGSPEGDSWWFEPKWVFAASLSVRRPGGAGDLRREPLKLAATTEPRSRVEANVAPSITQVRPCTSSSAAKTCPPPGIFRRIWFRDGSRRRRTPAETRP